MSPLEKNSATFQHGRMKIVAWLTSTLATLDPAPKPVDAAKPPVVVVHGIHATAKDMTRLVRALRADGREVFSPTLNPHDGTASIEELSAQLEQFILQQQLRQPFDLIGYSMGGIITRHYLQERDGMDHVRRYITLSAPHHGTWTALLNPGIGARQMRRGSTFLARLNRDASSLQDVSMTSFWVPTDLVILPPSSSVLSQATQVRMWGLGHFSFIIEPRCIRKVVEALQ